MLILIGPGQDQPCGIADYTARLFSALQVLTPTFFLPFEKVFSCDEIKSASAILVQYECGLMPSSDFMFRLGKQFPAKVYVVPHEVYEEDPFAFPYGNLSANNVFILILKKILYRLRHSDYNQEKILQANGYFSHKVIPLSEISAKILQMENKLNGVSNILLSIPLALPNLVSETKALVIAKNFQEKRNIKQTKFIVGIFGFLNPANDYATVFQAMHMVGEDIGLLIIGGDRANSHLQIALQEQILTEGLESRISISGYIPEADLAEYFSFCHAFICPFKFKSNTASALHLFTLGKPIFATNLPITQYLKEQGAPLLLYQNVQELSLILQAMIEGEITVKPNHYSWDFSKVAQAYVRAMGLEKASQSF